MIKEEIKEMASPFDSIKSVDDSGREWWNSRSLAKVLGYGKYWNFERLMEKAGAFLKTEKGVDISEHSVHLSGAVRKIQNVPDKWNADVSL